jgi:alanyl-tRNA synthetase
LNSTVDKPRRKRDRTSSTPVTHLLHWALHEVVSKGRNAERVVCRAGEVERFDFNHAPLMPQQVAEVEKAGQ